MPLPPAPYRAEATPKTPSILLDPGGTLSISGCSIPEDADWVFAPVFDAVEAYSAQPADRTTVRIALSYFNSSSAKQLLDLLKALEDLHASGRSKVELEWCHGPGDLDMKEAGRDYRSLLEFPVRLVELPD